MPMHFNAMTGADLHYWKPIAKARLQERANAGYEKCSLYDLRKIFGRATHGGHEKERHKYC